MLLLLVEVALMRSMVVCSRLIPSKPHCVNVLFEQKKNGWAVTSEDLFEKGYVILRERSRVPSGGEWQNAEHAPVWLQASVYQGASGVDASRCRDGGGLIVSEGRSG